jgi:7-cyano-7-deazaguanine synthase in queuosine biosynthesis
MQSYNITDTVEFNIYTGSVGICVSGGADSALMLYFALKYSNSAIHIFSSANQKKWLRNTHASINVISKCAELTGNYKFVHHIIYEVTQTKQNLFVLPMQYLADGIVSTVYTGVTKNPPFEVMKNFTLENIENFERDPTVVRSVKQGDWYMPWTNLDKQDLHTIYQQYDLLDTLFPVTRSCEWINQDWPDPVMGHCGKCWWCEERQWGFGKL